MEKIKFTKKAFVSIDLGASSGRIMVTQIGKSFNINEIYRFYHQTIDENGYTFWDFDNIMKHIEIGLTKVFETYQAVHSIGIDSWAIDYGLLDHQGNLLRKPISYRDQRTKKIIDEVHQVVDMNQLYEETGIQFLEFNTIYQMVEDNKYQQETMKQAKTLLLIPDLIAYLFTGIKRRELTNFSTTALYNPQLKSFNQYLKDLQIDESLFPPFIFPGETYGYLNDTWKNKLNITNDVKVIAVCTHDTASAFAASPQMPNSVFVNSGTWTLIGKTIEQPLINNQTQKLNFSNEVGYNHKIRFLKNSTGLYLINMLNEELKTYEDYKDMFNDLYDSNNYYAVINLDDPMITKEKSIQQGLLQACNLQKQEPPLEDKDYFRLILQSIAYSVYHAIDELSTLSHQLTENIVLVGGGSENVILVSMIKKLCGINLWIGHKETTVLGNALVLWLENHKIESLQEGIQKIYKNLPLKEIKTSRFDDVWLEKIKERGELSYASNRKNV